MSSKDKFIAQRLVDMTQKLFANETLAEQGFIKAESYLNAILIKDPSNIAAYLLAAKIFQFKIDHSHSRKDKNRIIVDAIQTLQQALTLDANNLQIKVLLAEFNFALQNYDLAFQYASQALSLGPSEQALVIKADCLVYKKDFPNALGLYVEAEKQDHLNNTLLAKKAYCLLHLGKYNAALEAADASLKYSPTFAFAKSLKKEITATAKKNKVNLAGVNS
jgi:tetratricopeptide (TPR) repeat protein